MDIYTDNTFEFADWLNIDMTAQFALLNTSKQHDVAMYFYLTSSGKSSALIIAQLERVSSSVGHLTAFIRWSRQNYVIFMQDDDAWESLRRRVLMRFRSEKEGMEHATCIKNTSSFIVVNWSRMRRTRVFAGGQGSKVIQRFLFAQQRILTIADIFWRQRASTDHSGATPCR